MYIIAVVHIWSFLSLGRNGLFFFSEFLAKQKKSLSVKLELHSVHRGITPHQKHHPSSFLQSPPPLNQQTAQAPFLGNPPSISVFGEMPPPKSQIF